MTEETAPDTCRPVQVDGQTIRVRGSGEMTPEAEEALVALVRVAKAKFVADAPEKVGELQQKLRLAHQARRGKEHQLDGIRRALCDAGFMEEDDPYGHADLEEVIRQAGMLMSTPDPEDPAKSPAVERLTQELHRRATHLDTIRNADEGLVMTDQWVMVTGEVQGLQGALGIALGGKVAGGSADELAQEHYRAWVVGHASECSRCRCDLCTTVLAGGAR